MNLLQLQKERIRKQKSLLTQPEVLFGSVYYTIISAGVQLAMYEAGLNYRRMNAWHYENVGILSLQRPATHYEPFDGFKPIHKKWTYNVDAVRVPYKSKDRLKNAVNYTAADGTKRFETT